MFKFKQFIKKYEFRLSLLAMAGGFIFDSITLTRIDLRLDNIILLSYLTLAGIVIILVNLLSREGDVSSFRQSLVRVLRFVMQFAFGGLLSGYLVFYLRSAALVSSWPFILLLIILVLGNEFFKQSHIRLTYQVTLFFAALFSFLIFFVPVLVGRIGAIIFVISGILSLLAIFIFIQVLKLIVPSKYYPARQYIKRAVVSLFIIFNVMYFTNVIPPIPLALKESGIYHEVFRQSGNYVLRGEPLPLREFYKSYNDVLRSESGGPVYAYTAVFAPTNLTTEIFHQWEYFDSGKDEWIVTDRIPLPVVGGGDGGYRGFTFKTKLFIGDWRVNVLTERNQLLGRLNFEFERGVIKKALITEIK